MSFNKIFLLAAAILLLTSCGKIEEVASAESISTVAMQTAIIQMTQAAFVDYKSFPTTIKTHTSTPTQTESQITISTETTVPKSPVYAINQPLLILQRHRIHR